MAVLLWRVGGVGMTPEAEDARPESMSRFNRFKSARSSAADWQRRSRSFSKALLMISSRLGGSSGFSRKAGSGGRCRIAPKIAAEVFPGKGIRPVAIS